ncbi:MAG: ATP-binding protein [Sphingobacteriales bacterium]
MNKSLVFLLAICFAGNAFSQQFYDSIKIHRQQYLKSRRSDSALVLLYLNLSNDYRRNNYDSCFYFGRKAYDLAKKDNLKLGEGFGLSAMEFALRETGDLPQALSIQLKSLDLARSLKNENLEAIELNSIGNTYFEMGNVKTALEYYRRSRVISYFLKDNYYICNETSNMGNAFEQLNQVDSALNYETRMYNDKTFPADLMPELLYRLGNVYRRLGNDKKALMLYQQGVALSFPVHTVSDRAICYYQIAGLYEKQHRLDSSLVYANKSISSARSISLRKMILSASLLAADIYSKTHRLDSAFFYQQTAMKYNDTLFGVEKFKKIQLVLSDEQRRKQMLLDQQEKLKTRYQVIVAAAVLLLVLVILFVVWRNNRVQKRKNHLLSLQKSQITAQRDEMQETLLTLKNTQTQLIQSEKMASLGELTAGVAHEIQNPLNFVNNFAEVSVELFDEMQTELRSGDKDEAISIAEDIKQNLEKIRHHGQRADGIVKGMLQHSRASSNTKEPADINKLADEYLRLAYHGLRAKDKNFNCELVTAFDDKLPLVNVVPQDIGRVLLNMFTNAFYATEQKLKNLGAQYKPAVKVGTSLNANVIEIRVRDNGSGIPENIQAKIMQPFFTSKPTGEGTGLGLSLSYDIVVKGHGGTIEVDSSEGNYTEFVIRLPVITTESDKLNP